MIIAYHYDGDLHCPECALSQFSDLEKASDSVGEKLQAIESIDDWFEKLTYDDDGFPVCIDCLIELDN